MQKKYKLLWIAIGSLIIIIIVLGLWLRLPWLANHFGFALPGPGGLPYRISYAGRAYANTATCAHADWCQIPH